MAWLGRGRRDENAAKRQLDVLVTDRGPAAAAAAVELRRLAERGCQMDAGALFAAIDGLAWDEFHGRAPTDDGVEFDVARVVAWSLRDVVKGCVTAEHIPVLTRYLHSGRTDTLVNIATFGLRSIDDLAVPQILAEGMRLPGAADACFRALLSYRGPGASEPLLDLFTDGERLAQLLGRRPGDIDTQLRQIADHLGFLGDHRAVGPLLAWQEQMKGRPTGHAGRAVELALGRLGGSEAIDSMLARLAAGDESAALGLGASGDPRAVPALISALQQPHCQNVVLALGKIGDRRAVPTLIAKFQTEQHYSSLQARIADALAKIGDKSALPTLEAADGGPVSKEQWRFASDDGIWTADLQSQQGIHEAVLKLKSGNGH